MLFSESIGGAWKGTFSYSVENFSRFWDLPAYTEVIKRHLNLLNIPTVL